MTRAPGRDPDEGGSKKMTTISIASSQILEDDAFLHALHLARLHGLMKMRIERGSFGFDLLQPLAPQQLRHLLDGERHAAPEGILRWGRSFFESAMEVVENGKKEPDELHRQTIAAFQLFTFESLLRILELGLFPHEHVVKLALGIGNGFGGRIHRFRRARLRAGRGRVIRVHADDFEDLYRVLRARLRLKAGGLISSMLIAFRLASRHTSL